MNENRFFENTCRLVDMQPLYKWDEFCKRGLCKTQQNDPVIARARWVSVSAAIPTRYNVALYPIGRLPRRYSSPEYRDRNHGAARAKGIPSVQ
jgi:hypothetical protein